MSDKPVSGIEPVTIKKYANRRLYNTAASSYVTLDNLAQMVKEGVDFVVYDAKSGDDITRSVLTQIIVEEEGKGDSLLPIGFLRQLIGYYGDSLGGMVPSYLELSMETFTRNQQQMRERMSGSASGSRGAMSPLKQIEEMGQANMKLFQNAMEMFTPFAADSPKKNSGGAKPGSDTAPAESDDAIADLKAKLDAMQSQLDSIAIKKRD
jgi:polyhydroxyalkanoate synthesis repressor PhaR